MHGPGSIRPAARVAAVAAMLTVLVSCGHSLSPASSPSSRGALDRSQDDATYSWVSVNGLNGVAAVSSHSAWAVGSAATGVPLVMHWDGRAWQQVPSASPRGATEGLLNSVAATGSSTAWAAGYYNTSKRIKKTLIERWNGRSWAQVPSPNPGGLHGSFLLGVAVTGPSNAWAVGYYNTGKSTRTLIERWNGRSWAQVPSPNPGGSYPHTALNGVAAAGNSTAWAVGYYFAPSLRPLIERWNGRAWQVVTSPNPGGCCNTLNAVTTVGKSAAWAVGTTGKKGEEALIERWNGRAWAQVASPSPGGLDARLNGVAAAGTSTAWAVGAYFGPSLRPLIERWNGRAWNVVTSPNPGGCCNALTAVATVGESAAWTVGTTGKTVDEALIERWNGRAWTQEPSPRPAGSRGSILTGIAARSPANAWAVGYYYTKPKTEPAVRTLIERWNGRAWTQEPSPNPGGSAVHSPDQSLLQAVGAVSSSQAWAAGSYSSGNPRGTILIERRAGGTWSQVPAGR